MKSKLFVEYDFDRNEPYLQLTVDGTSPKDPSERPDLRDVALKNFTETASGSLMYLTYSGTTLDPYQPQIRVLTPYKTPESIMQLIIANFELFAKQWFQEKEMEHVDSFFSALRVKCSLKASVK